VAVADARSEVKAAARIVLSHNGGEGAVREICELVLAAHTAAATGSRNAIAEMTERAS
jgi:N-acylneuraminate cytidylyltransferase